MFIQSCDGLQFAACAGQPELCQTSLPGHAPFRGKNNMVTTAQP